MCLAGKKVSRGRKTGIKIAISFTMSFSSMKMQKYLALFLLVTSYVFLRPVIAVGEDIRWFEEQSLSFDRELKVLRLQLKNTLISIEKKNLEKTLSVSAGVKDTGLSYAFESGTTGLSSALTTTPTISVGLPSPYETSLQLSFPLSYSYGRTGGTGGGENPLDFSPSVNINQPLNKLLGLEENSSYDTLSDRYLVEQNRVKIAEREYDVRLNLYKNLKDIFQAEENVKDLEVQIGETRKTVEDTIKLGNYDKNSSSFMALENTVKRLERNREIALATLENEKRRLKRLIGEDFDSLPWNILSEGENIDKLDLETERNISWYPDYYLGKLALLRDQAKLKQDRAAKIPTLSAQLNLNSGGAAGKNSIDVSGGFQGIFDNVSLSASLGGTLNPGSIYAYFGFSWQLPDRRLENLDTENDENITKIDAIQLGMVKEQYENGIESLKLTIDDLRSRKSQLEDDIRLARLKLKEAKLRFSNGLISQEELNKAQWDLNRLKYERVIFLLDVMSTKEELEKLNLIKGFQGS